VLRISSFAVGLAVLGLLALVVVVLVRWFPRRALRAVRARRVGEIDLPELAALVRELSAEAGVAAPALFVSPTTVPNAFAVGTGRRRAALCCTEGLLTTLSQRELAGVLAHELAHIRAGHTAVGSTLGLLVASWLPAPVARVLMAATASTRRETAADLAAARLTGDPLGLASALRRLEVAATRWQLPPERFVRACAHLMTVDPLSGRQASPTHPETANRVARLEQLAGYRR